MSTREVFFTYQGKRYCVLNTSTLYPQEGYFLHNPLVRLIISIVLRYRIQRKKYCMNEPSRAELMTLLADMHGLMLDVMPHTYRDGTKGAPIYERYQDVVNRTSSAEQESESESELAEIG